jgi:hypothetical protein
LEDSCYIVVYLSQHQNDLIILEVNFNLIVVCGQ